MVPYEFRGEEMGILIAKGYREAFWDDQKCSKTEYGDGCSTLWLYYKSFNCIFSTNGFYGMWIIFH